MNEADKFLAARNKAQNKCTTSFGAIGGHEVAPLQVGSQRFQQASRERDSVLLIGLSLLSGMFAILSAIIRQLIIGMPDLLAAIMVAPPVEEILKAAIPIMVLEHRANWLSRGRDLLWFAMGSALVFAVVENLLYQFFYLENPSSELLMWRWIACTAMHVTATGLSGVGLMRTYERGVRTGRKPRFVWEWPWLIGAIAVHMAYNAYAALAAPF